MIFRRDPGPNPTAPSARRTCNTHSRQREETKEAWEWIATTHTHTHHQKRIIQKTRRHCASSRGAEAPEGVPARRARAASPRLQSCDRTRRASGDAAAARGRRRRAAAPPPLFFFSRAASHARAAPRTRWAQARARARHRERRTIAAFIRFIQSRRVADARRAAAASAASLGGGGSVREGRSSPAARNVPSRRSAAAASPGVAESAARTRARDARISESCASIAERNAEATAAGDSAFVVFAPPSRSDGGDSGPGRAAPSRTRATVSSRASDSASSKPETLRRLRRPTHRPTHRPTRHLTRRPTRRPLGRLADHGFFLLRVSVVSRRRRRPRTRRGAERRPRPGSTRRGETRRRFFFQSHRLRSCVSLRRALRVCRRATTVVYFPNARPPR